MLTIGACSQGSTVEATIEPSAHWRTLALDNYRTLHHTLSPRSPQDRATNNHSRILIDKLKGDLKRKQSSHLQDLVTHASMKSKNLQLAASLEDQRLVIAQLRQTNQR
jgi:predicted secreted Zn-dependent protease